MMIRKAKINDAKGILDIRNHEYIRNLSNNSEIISLENHIKWFQNKLSDERNIILIAENDGFIEGFCRLDFIENGKYLISIAVSPNKISKGLGSNLIQNIIAQLKKGDTIIAEILEDNLPSIAFFQKFGFKEIKKGVYELIINDND